MTRVRLIITVITLFSLVGAGVAWILSTESIISNTWTPPRAGIGAVYLLSILLFGWWKFISPYLPIIGLVVLVIGLVVLGLIIVAAVLGYILANRH